MREREGLLRRMEERLSRVSGWRIQASLDAMKADYDVPPPHFAIRRTELDTFWRHLHTTARLTSVLSNVDAPGWDAANEEYERSWDELERAGDATSP